MHKVRRLHHRLDLRLPQVVVAVVDLRYRQLHSAVSGTGLVTQVLPRA
jgi:hypothetical protein